MADPSLNLAPRIIDDDIITLTDAVPEEARNLFIYGLGYTGQYIARALKATGWQVGGTSRQADIREALQSEGIEAVDFTAATQNLTSYSNIISTIGPARDGSGDYVLDAFADDLAASEPRWVGYFSATSVYGAGPNDVWVDENYPTEPTNDRGARRLTVENDWADWGIQNDVPVSRFRIAGIYGPGRNILEQLQAGTARIIDKPEHVFNRVHVEDIARAVVLRLSTPKPMTIDNLADGHPMSQKDWAEKAAQILGVEAPTPIPFETAEATLSPIGRSFWQDSKRIKAPRFE